MQMDTTSEGNLLTKLECFFNIEIVLKLWISCPAIEFTSVFAVI